MNEDESRKTIADEIKTCPLCGGRVFWFPISNYWGCENCKNTFNRYTVFPDEVKKTSAVGNAAAMREALQKIKGLFRDIDLSIDCTENEAYAIADKALSAPPRQCDVGTAEEQSDMFADFCDSHSGCSQCPVKALWSFANGHKPSCGVLWAQMPYVAEEGARK